MNRWTDEPVMDQLGILEEGGGVILNGSMSLKQE